jgi:hypothetical protein
MLTPRRVATALVIMCVLVLFGSRAAAHDEFRFVGSIVKMDAAKGLVSVKYKEYGGKEEVVDVKIVATTKITRDGKAVPKSELRAGVYVVVDALGCEDEYDAVAVKIVPPPKE